MSRQSDRDNHANQMNPNNDAYWQSRGLEERPDDWEERVEDSEDHPVNAKDANVRGTRNKT